MPKSLGSYLQDHKFSIVLSTITVLVMMLIALSPNLSRIRGSHFLDSNALVTTYGRIISSGTARNSPKSRVVGYDIWYEYRVKGRYYRSNVVTFAKVGTSDPQFAYGYINKYPQRKFVVVYYHPETPSFCVLEPNVKGSYVDLMLVFGLIVTFLLVEAVWVIKGLRQ